METHAVSAGERDQDAILGGKDRRALWSPRRVRHAGSSMASFGEALMRFLMENLILSFSLICG